MNVLVTGVGGGGHGEQIIKALRLSSLGYRIIGTDMSPMSKGLQEVDVAEMTPPAGDSSYVDALLALCDKHDVKALFHGSEPELKVLSRNREFFERRGIFLPINPPSVIETCMDKIRTFRFLAERGFAMPQYWEIRSSDDLRRVSEMPVVIKPSVGGGGSANLFIAQSVEELYVYGEMLLKIYPEFVVQEYVGTPDHEYTVGVLYDMNGVFINSIAVRRFIMSALSNRLKVPNRTRKSELGNVLAVSSGVSQGEVGHFPNVTGPCEEMARELGACGAINIQCRLCNGRVLVFEINPRFSGTTSLRAMVGYNEPDILIRKHLLGQTIQPRFPYQSGVVLRGLSESLVRTNPAT